MQQVVWWPQARGYRTCSCSMHTVISAGLLSQRTAVLLSSGCSHCCKSLLFCVAEPLCRWHSTFVTRLVNGTSKPAAFFVPSTHLQCAASKAVAFKHAGCCCVLQQALHVGASPPLVEGSRSVGLGGGGFVDPEWDADGGGVVHTRHIAYQIAAILEPPIIAGVVVPGRAAQIGALLQPLRRQTAGAQSLASCGNASAPAALNPSAPTPAAWH